MADATASAAPASTPTPVKAGWRTSEFWSHLAVQLGIGALTYIMAHNTALPGPIAPLVPMVGPLAMAWLQSQYSDDRAKVKMAAQG